MNIAIGADHRGEKTIEPLCVLLKNEGHEVWLPEACPVGQPCDYPDRAWQICNHIASGEADRGILICGSGIGMSIAANKIDGIRAALVHDELTAQMSRGHNDANVLCLSADLLGQKLIENIVKIWLTTEFEGGRHERRVRKIAMIEQGIDPATASADQPVA
ncbi:MAG: ribose 5-phosphate isomerase B [Phycisphaeraceae bacterium]|nr:ribose 5-phosphate isomerase B [Phycisphaerales bacterium]MCB9859931.1 ribose 5-phosphate isomerase B [Phycisphaeraceae bacterium]